MKALVAGSWGMLARDLIPCLSEQGHEAIAPPEDRFDVTHLSSVRENVARFEPEIVVNCAAYTNVDGAETEEREALTVNGLAVQNLCLACQERGIPLVHFSTDYVFDGAKEGAYTIYDRPNPLGAYGRSKLLGERYVLWLLTRFYLIRTSWLFGHHGRNFIETMLELAEKRDTIRVVSDQHGCPTWTRHLAEAVVDLIATGRYGVYHITNSEPTTWFDFAREILRLAGKEAGVVPIATDEFPTPARRPRNSVLDPFPLSQVLKRDMPSWRAALEDYLRLRETVRAATSQ